MLKATLAIFLVLALSFLPAVSFGATPIFTMSPTSGPVGTKVNINGTIPTAKSSPVSFMFDVVQVATVNTNSSGKFVAAFFVPLVAKGDYSVSINVNNTPINYTQKFRVTFGIDTIESELTKLNKAVFDMKNDLSAIGDLLKKQSENNTQYGSIITKMQSKLLEISKNLSTLQTSVSGLGGSITGKEDSRFDSLDNAISTLSNSVSSLRDALSKLNQTMSITENRESALSQLFLISIETTAVVAVLLIVGVMYTLRRRRGSKTDDWEVFG